LPGWQEVAIIHHRCSLLALALALERSVLTDTHLLTVLPTGQQLTIPGVSSGWWFGTFGFFNKVVLSTPFSVVRSCKI
jgi:hypothetical protein